MKDEHLGPVARALCGAACIAFAGFCVAMATGCATLYDEALAVLDAAGEAEAQTETPEAQKPAASSPAASDGLVYRYGGFDGSRAVEDPNTQIGSVRMSKSGMSYRWTAGSLKNWGISDTAADALACAFYWDGKEWVGGKFDWISTSRTTRDFKNVSDHYHGWEPDKFFGAKRRAFCIVSKDGKRRTNIAEDGK